jgi:hypothetical protein
VKGRQIKRNVTDRAPGLIPIKREVSEAAPLCTLENANRDGSPTWERVSECCTPQVSAYGGEPLGLKMIPTTSFAEQSDQA